MARPVLWHAVGGRHGQHRHEAVRETTPDGQIELGADTNEGKHANGYFRTAIGGNRFVLFGSKDKATGFKPFSDADYQPSGTDRKRGYNVGNYGVKYAYDFGDTVRTSFGYQHTDATLDYARPFNIASASNKRDEDLITAKIDVTAGENLDLFVKGYYHDWDTRFSETDNDGAGGLDVISDKEFWGFKDYGANLLAKYSPAARWNTSRAGTTSTTAAKIRYS